VILKRIYNSLKLFKLLFRDNIKFIFSSAVLFGDYKNDDTLLSSITMDYHRIEKGLSLPNPREKFGYWFIPSLIERILYFKGKYGNHDVLNHAVGAINAYRSYHSKKDVLLSDLQFWFKKLDDSRILPKNIGIKKLNITTSSKKSFETLSLERSSVRNFLSKEVDIELINNAVEIAKRTPSVCNRQPWRVKFVAGEKVNPLLALQNGNKGFSECIRTLIVVTGKISYMRLPVERHQIYIDGGMFSMSLIYALQDLGISTCPLNWCVNTKNDKIASKELGLDGDEEIIMYIAVGYPKKKCSVASSPRLPNKLILKKI